MGDVKSSDKPTGLIGTAGYKYEAPDDAMAILLLRRQVAKHALTLAVTMKLASLTKRKRTDTARVWSHWLAGSMASDIDNIVSASARKCVDHENDKLLFLYAIAKELRRNLDNGVRRKRGRPFSKPNIQAGRTNRPGRPRLLAAEDEIGWATFVLGVKLGLFADQHLEEQRRDIDVITSWGLDGVRKQPPRNDIGAALAKLRSIAVADDPLAYLNRSVRHNVALNHPEVLKRNPLSKNFASLKKHLQRVISDHELALRKKSGMN